MKKLSVMLLLALAAHGALANQAASDSNRKFDVEMDRRISGKLKLSLLD